MKGIAISGFGRIGRSTLKVALRNDLFVPSVIADIKDFEILADLFASDTNYGNWPDTVKFSKGQLVIGRERISCIDTSKGMPDWGNLGVGVVIDCTGRATKREVAQEHLDHGAKKVLVSAPSKSKEDCDAFLLWGINFPREYDPAQHHIISMASCTTNALAPVVKVLKDNYGIKTGFFITVHAYTNSQSLTDQPMKDRADSWAACENIIPASSGAAKALGYIWPELGDSITGIAYRVPTRTVSIVEFVTTLKEKTSVADVNDCFFSRSGSHDLRDIMTVEKKEFASCRYIGQSHSSIVSLPLTKMLGGNMLSIKAWYDNEWGYSARLAEMAKVIADNC